MEYQLIERGPFSVVGIRRVTPDGGGTWGIVKSDGSNDRAKSLFGRYFDLGLCFGFGEDGSDDYMCAVEYDGAPPEGFDSYTCPASSWLKFAADGPVSANTLGDTWWRINSEFLPQSKYKKSELPTIENYILWDNDADICNVEIWIPVSLK